MSLIFELHERSKRFHAEIARRAALVASKQDRSYSVPNVPFGVKKVAPPRTVPPAPRNIEPDYWPSMWFYDLVFGRMTSAQPRIEEIIRVVCQEFNVSKLDLLSSRRTKDVVLPRQIACYLSRKLTDRTFPDIARRLGGKDHSTMIFAFRKIAGLVQCDEVLKERINAIARSFGGSIA